MPFRRAACPALLAALLAAAPAAAEERYFLLMFGAQQMPPDPDHAHSFAVFVRACGEGPCPQGWKVEHFPISWLPRTLEVRVWKLLPECGVNLPYHESVRLALADGQRVSLWGPYEIETELYVKAAEQMAKLESGKVRYKAPDFGYQTRRVTNCIHALSVISGGLRMRSPTSQWGETASYNILERYDRWLINPCVTHDWLICHLGLAEYPLIRRPYGERPRSGAAWSALRGALHREEYIRSLPPAACEPAVVVPPQPADAVPLPPPPQ